jgi:hypothetical protein
MILPVLFVSYAEAPPVSAPPGPSPVTLADRVEHPHPIAAGADHPRHLAGGILLFVVLLLALGIMGRPVLRWRRRSDDMVSRPTSSH